MDNQSLQENILSALLDTIPDMFYAKNSDLQFTHINNAMLEVFGLKRENVIGKTADEVWHGDYAEEFSNWNIKVINGRQIIAREEYIVDTKGVARTFDTIRIPVWADGEISGVLGVARDITEYKEREKAAEDSYEYTRLLNESLVRITRSSALTVGDLEAAAMFIAQEGCTTLNVRSSGVWRLAADESALNNISYYVAETGKHSIAEDYSMDNDPKYAGKLKTQRLIVTGNISAYDYEVNDQYNVGLCAYLEAPVYASGKLYGVISIEQNRCDMYPDGREWTLEEQSYASSLADMMALAIAGSERRIAYEKLLESRANER